MRSSVSVFVGDLKLLVQLLSSIECHFQVELISIVGSVVVEDAQG